MSMLMIRASESLIDTSVESNHMMTPWSESDESCN